MCVCVCKCACACVLIKLNGNMFSQCRADRQVSTGVSVKYLFVCSTGDGRRYQANRFNTHTHSSESALMHELLSQWSLSLSCSTKDVCLNSVIQRLQKRQPECHLSPWSPAGLYNASGGRVISLTGCLCLRSHGDESPSWEENGS